MNKAAKRVRNRARKCWLCDEPMTMDDRKLFAGSVGHPACWQRKWETERAEVAAMPDQVASWVAAVARMETRHEAGRIGLWVP